MNNSGEDEMNLKGEFHISMAELLKSLLSLEGNNRGMLVRLLLRTFLRTYIVQIPRGSHKDFTISDSCLKRYPSSTLHEIKTGSRNLNIFFTSMKTEIQLELV